MSTKTPAGRSHRLIVSPSRRLAVAVLSLGCTLVSADNAPTMPDAVPPFILQGVAPNLIITLDNSDSMRQASSFEYYGSLSADDLNLELTSRYYSSPDFNSLYYNPIKTYVPALEATGGSLGNARFDAAHPDTFYEFGCAPENLANDYRVLIRDEFRKGNCDDSEYLQIEDPDFGVPWAKPGPAFYHRFSPGPAGCLASPADYAAGTYPPDKCFRRIEVGSAAEQADWAAHNPGRPYSAEAARTNFANWFQYYRTRALTLKTVMSRVLPDLSPRVRVTWQSLHSGDFLPDSPRMLDLQARLAPFSDQTRRSLYDWVVSLRMTEDTYLISSHVRAGEFIKTGIAQADNIAAHRGNVEFTDNSCGVKCRPNFHLLFTDGFWTDSWESQGSPQPPPCTPGNDCLLGEKANQDGSAHALPANPFGLNNFVPAINGTSRLFSDNNTATLADAAFYYWRRDLWPSAPNRVPRHMPVVLPNTVPTDPANFWDPRNNPASWQHLVLFPIAIGATGNVAALKDQSGRPYDGTYTISGGGQLSDNGFPGNFSSVGPDLNGQPRDFPEEYKFDDLLHAAFNSRGQYFEASDPDSLLSSFRQVLLSVSAAVGTSAHGSLALSSGVLQTDTRVYQVLVNTLDWSGELQAFTVSQGNATEGKCAGVPRGQVCESVDNPLWRASERLPAHSTRTILTRGSDGPMAFRPAHFASLSEAQHRGLVGCDPAPDRACDLTDVTTIQRAKDRMNWLRGDQTLEGSAPDSFRVRESRLGDILSSSVESVGAPGRVFDDSGYVAFRTRHAARDEIVYVGANDGMLHGFDGETGVEKLAYVPEAIYPYLYTLTQPGYGVDPVKRAFVDGAVTAADAKIGAGEGADAWRTVLVGTFGVGAQGAYALDVTSPGDFNESTPSAVVLWEFTDRSGSDDGALDGRDMGFSGAKPAVVPVKGMQDNTATARWVVLLSNGYSNDNRVDEIFGHCSDAQQANSNCTISQTGNAVLYVLDLKGADGADGAPANRILAKLDTGQGKAQDPAEQGRAAPDEPGERGRGAPDEPGERGRGAPDEPGERGRGAPDESEERGRGAPDESEERGRGAAQDRPERGRPPPQDQAQRGRANGLAQVLPVDNNGDMVVDIAYAGDLFGNLWRFDLTNLANPQPPRLLFKAKYPHADAVAVGDKAQPITAPLGVARHPTGIGNLVYFGTGRFLNTEDKSDLSIQTFYAIWDAPGRDYVATAAPATTPVITQSQLLQQTFTHNATSDPPEGQSVMQARVSSTNDINWITHRGWYIDLVTYGTQSQSTPTAEGERVITQPVVRDGRVLFVSSIPADCCDAGGQSWLTMLDAYSGKRLSTSGIDFTRDGVINIGDQVKVIGGNNNEKVVGSSIAVAGVAPSPALLAVAPGSVSMWRTDEQGKPTSEEFSEINSMRNWVQLR